MTDYAPLGHYDYTGTGPMMEYAVTSGSGRIYHLLVGEGATSEAIGIGVDHDGGNGQVISVKANDSIGLGINLETTSGAGAIGFLGAVLAEGKAVELRKGSQDGGTLLSLRADYGGTGTLAEWGQGAGDVKGQISETGNLTITDAELSVRSSDTDQSQARITAVAGGTLNAHYVYSGTPDLWFPNAIAAYGNSLAFQQGSAATIGGETMTNLIELKNANSIGFFGATPVTKPVLTYSRATENAAQTQIRAALAALGLVTDSTVA